MISKLSKLILSLILIFSFQCCYASFAIGYALGAESCDYDRDELNHEISDIKQELHKIVYQRQIIIDYYRQCSAKSTTEDMRKCILSVEWITNDN